MALFQADRTSEETCREVLARLRHDGALFTRYGFRPIRVWLLRDQCLT
ncbi:hypothetical protein QMZ92_17010 [Streptomyces sp. HNM0645]|nr:hypothetical protein [Streptomyces sp. HNM0645]MDI9886032.1 hypothetical protein [Streptomyces sp. HNM0645]